MQSLLKSEKKLAHFKRRTRHFFTAATYVAQQCEELVFEIPYQQWSRFRTAMLRFMYTA